MVYDLTLTVQDSLPFYPGERGFEIYPMKTIEQDGANVSYIVSSLHVGTHIDTPIHFVDGGRDAAEIDLEKYYGKARVFSLECRESVERSDIEKMDFEPGDIVLLNIKRNNELLLKTEFDKSYTYLSADGAACLVEKGAKAVGINAFSIAPCFPVEGKTSHHILLEKEVVILEGLYMQDIPDGEYTLFALPLKIKDGNGSPVRAVLFSGNHII